MLRLILLAAAFARSFSASAQEASKEMSDIAKVNAELNFDVTRMYPKSESIYYSNERILQKSDLFGILSFTRNDGPHNIFKLSPAFRTNFEEAGQPINTLFFEAFVDSRLTTLSQPSDLGLQLTAGKKREKYGFGELVRPSDLFNISESYFDERFAREGETFARLQVQNKMWSFGLGMLPRTSKNSNEGRAWALVTFRAPRSQIELQATQEKEAKAKFGLALSQRVQRIYVYWDGRYQTTQRNLAEEIPQEAAFSSYQGDQASGFYLGGVRIAFVSLKAPTERYVAIEGIQQQNGLLPIDTQAFFEKLAQDGGQAGRSPVERLISRRYAHAVYKDSTTLESWTLHLRSLYDVNGKSAFHRGCLSKRFSKISSAGIEMGRYTGDRYTEFGERPVRDYVQLQFDGTL